MPVFLGVSLEDEFITFDIKHLRDLSSTRVQCLLVFPRPPTLGLEGGRFPGRHGPTCARYAWNRGERRRERQP